MAYEAAIQCVRGEGQDARLDNTHFSAFFKWIGEHAGEEISSAAFVHRPRRLVTYGILRTVKKWSFNVVKAALGDEGANFIKQDSDSIFPTWEKAKALCKAADLARSKVE